MFINRIAHYIPNSVYSNAYFEAITERTDEWLVARTGIKERRRASLGENTNTMAMEAVRKLAEQLPYPKESIDLIVCGTYTPYDTIVSPAHLAQHYLDIDRIPVLMLSTACSSFLSVMEVIEGYFASGKASQAMAIVADHNSAYNDNSNQQWGHLWGDGAAALLVSKDRLSEEDLEVEEIITSGAANVGKGIEGVMLNPSEGE